MEFNEKLKDGNEIVKNIKYSCKPKSKYVKSKTKVHKNVEL